MIDTAVLHDDGTSTVLTQWGERGPILLCVHGMTSSRVGWTRFAQRLSSRARVFAYDQRGHGDMSASPGPMSLKRSLDDLARVAEIIGEPIDGLIGHSWGGAVAIRGAARIGVRRTIAIDPMIHQVSSVWYDEYLEELKLIFALQGLDREAQIRHANASLHPLDLEGKVHAMRSMQAIALERLRDENPPEEWDLRGEIASFPLPLLIALADPAESIISGEDYHFLEELQNPNVTVEVFEGEGHSLHRRAFDRFAAAVESYMQ